MSNNQTLDNALQEESELTRLVLGSIASIISIITTVGNLLLLSVIFISRPLRKKQTAFLIANLAIADLLVGATVMPLSAMLIFTNRKWLLSRNICRLWVSLDVVNCTASILTLMGISLDRLVGVTRPLHYNCLITRRRVFMGNVAVWVVSLSILVATIRWNSKSIESPGNFTCSVGAELQYVLYSTIFSFYIPLIVILTVYFKIFRVTRRRERSLILSAFYQAVTISNTSARHNASVDSDVTRPSLDAYASLPLRMHCRSSEGKQHSNPYAKQKRSAKMLAVVIGAFAVCWIPFFLVHPADALCNQCFPPVVLDLFTWLGYVNSAINPMIYALSMRSYSKAFREVLINFQSYLEYLCMGRERPMQKYSTATTLSRTSSVIARLHGSKTTHVLCNPAANHAIKVIHEHGKGNNEADAKTRAAGDMITPDNPSLGSIMNLKLYRMLVSSEATDL